MRNRLRRLVVVGAAAALVLAACVPGADDATTGFEECDENPTTCNSGERADGGTMYWTLDQAPDGYFPWSPEGGSVYTLQAIHGILPYFGQHLPDGDYQHNLDVLAGEPELLSEDPFTYQFQINEQAVWDDGTPISADDVIVTWRMSTSEDEGHCVGCRPRSTALWDGIESIEGTDDGKTVTITHKEGVANPEWFAFGGSHNVVGGIAPAHVAGQNDWDIDNPEDLGAYFEFLNDNPPTFSGGPFLIEEFDPDVQVIKVPNPNWYGAEPVTLDRLVIRFITDEDSWVPALNNREIHGASPAGWAGDVIRQVQDIPDVRVYLQPGPSWEHLDVNLDNEWLADVELRRAIFTMIDQRDLADRIFGNLYPDVTVRTNHLHDDQSEYHVDHLTGTGQGSGDLERARQILAEAGYEGYDAGPGGLTLDGEQIGPLRLRSTASPARATSLQLIQAYLGEIGLEVNLEPTDDLGGTLGGQDYDLIQFGWSGSPLFSGTGAQFWESGSGSNFGGYSNPEVDALVEQESQATSLQESAELHDQMMELVVADAYVLPLYDSPVYVFVADDFVNVRDNTNTSLRALYQHHEWGQAAQ